MKGQKRNDVKTNMGITLVSLVVSIIVMLILAGVSINAVVGENGILTQAQEAALATELARIKEELEYMFLDFNIGDGSDTISQFLNNKVDDGSIEAYKAVSTGSEMQMIIIKDGYYFLVEESAGSYYATLMDTGLDSIGAGVTVVTKDSFDSSSGTMTIEAGDGETTIMFYDEIEGEMNFDIVSGTVTIYITQDMKLTNQDMERSAIDIHTGATLNLYLVNGITMTVDSSYGGVSGSGTSADDIYGGSGAYAGIHVPEGATFNVYGEGTLIAYGGDAGDGGTCPANTYDYGGAGGGRSWCRNRWQRWKWRRCGYKYRWNQNRKRTRS